MSLQTSWIKLQCVSVLSRNVPKTDLVSIQERDRCGVPLMLPATVNLLLNLRVPVPWENEERRRRAQEKSPDLVPCLVSGRARPRPLPGQRAAQFSCVIIKVITDKLRLAEEK